MRQYRISPEENYRSNSARVWTIPIPNITSSLTNNNQNPPSYNEFINTSSNQLNDLPPNYFDNTICIRTLFTYSCHFIRKKQR